MKVFIVTGASGGHIFPAASLAQSIKLLEPQAELLLMLPKRSKISLGATNYTVVYSNSPRLTLAFNRVSILSLYGLAKAFFEDLKVMLDFKADIVVGFGSLDSLGMVFCAWLFRIKTVIHEQNVIAGKANRLLAKFVDRVALSFEQTIAGLKVRREKIILTGNPLREAMKIVEPEIAAAHFSLKSEKFTILVVGGSQGSGKINSVFADAITTLPGKENLQVIHLSGKNDREALVNRYTNEKVNARVFDFFSQMQFAYSAADLVICRAGAITISELIYFSLPAVLLPYPYAYGHQMANAKVLADQSCAIIIEDAKLSGLTLKDALSGLINSPQKLSLMRQGYKKFPSSDAAEKLALEVIKLGVL